MTTQPYPFFDTLDNIGITPKCVSEHLRALRIPACEKEYRLCVEFLKSYSNSPDTFNTYRREVERLLQYTYLIARKALKEMDRNDIREYLAFIVKPPFNFVGIDIANRFIVREDGERVVNPAWRPFVIRISKEDRRAGRLPSLSEYKLSSKSMENIFASLDSFFTFLQQEEYLEVNPISLIRQKKAYIQREQVQRVTRKLSSVQWQYVINVCEKMAEEDSQNERVLFMLSTFYLLGVRISELAYTPKRKATMGSFAQDREGLWWFTTVSKGNKIRDIAVPDELLAALARYRLSLGLSARPVPHEAFPLFPKQRGEGGLGSHQIREIVGRVFDRAGAWLKATGQLEEALGLSHATVHYLRHTSISNDIESRPREHIRDDVGHDSISTMDKYIDTDRQARHASARHKQLKSGFIDIGEHK